MIYKIISEYIQENIPGCSFVGIEEKTGELLVTFDHEDYERRRLATSRLVGKFEEVSKIIVVEQVDFKQLTKMVEELNKPDLLDIGDF